MRAPAFWHTDGAAAHLLAPLAIAYTAAGHLRRRLTTPYRPSVPVVCVGNVVAGGAGKTPVALALGAALAQSGRRVCFLSRGYGGTARGPLRVDPETHHAALVGDEPLLLAAVAPTWIARDRAAGARAIEAAGGEVIVMDDGLQNPAVARSLSFLVVDGGYGFGNGRVMPAGPLREPVADALARADRVVLLGDDETGAAGRTGRVPVLHGRLTPAGAAAGLRGTRVYGFAGIGRPGKFFATLAEIGAEVAGARGFPDHHRYTPDEIMAVCEAAMALGARPVTTAKDHVRLPPAARAMIGRVDVAVAWREPDVVAALLESLWP